MTFVTRQLDKADTEEMSTGNCGSHWRCFVLLSVQEVFEENNTSRGKINHNVCHDLVIEGGERVSEATIVHDL